MKSEMETEPPDKESCLSLALRSLYFGKIPYLEWLLGMWVLSWSLFVAENRVCSWES